jgi:hypothetical protein
LKFFKKLLGIDLVLVWQNTIFIQNKTVKIDLKMCLSNNPLGQQFLNKKKSNQPNKALVPDPNKTNQVDSKILVQPKPNKHKSQTRQVFV